jgi:hypothetical protein
MNCLEEQAAPDLRELLKTKGVDCKGYGKIYKYPLLDRSISADAKGAYALICSFSGNCFLKTKTMAAMLKIGGKRVKKALKELSAAGYITKTPRGGRGTPKYSPTDSALIGGVEKKLEKCGGYGLMPKAAFYDDRLPFRAKVIYAVQRAFARMDGTTFLEREEIWNALDICEKTYQNHQRLLVQYNYLTTTQRHDGGRFSVCDYTLNRTPDEAAADSSVGRVAVGARDERGNFVADRVVTFLRGAKNAARNAAKTLENILETKNDADRFSVVFNEGDVLRELLGSRKLPYVFNNDYSTNARAMSTAIRYLSEWDTQNGGWTDNMNNAAYKLAVEALSDMCAKKPGGGIMKPGKSAAVSYARAIDKLNETLANQRGRPTIFAAIETAMTKYKSAIAEGARIRNELKYMQSCVWDSLLVGEIGGESDIYRDFGSGSGSRV